MKYCQNCGALQEENNNQCNECGAQIVLNSNTFPTNLQKENSFQNPFGLIGLIVAISSLLIPIYPIDTIIGFLALILSIVGLKAPKVTLAVVGVVVSSYAIVASILLEIIFNLF